MKDLYAVLALEKGASVQEIKKSYKKLALQYHPDKNPGDPHAEEFFKRVNAAYAILSDPERKAQYDLSLALKEVEDEDPPAETYKQRRPRPVQVTPLQVRFLPFYIVLGFAVLIFIFWRFFYFMEAKAANQYVAKAENAYFQQGNYLLAWEMLNIALEKSEEHPGAHYLLGLIFMETQQNYQAAIYHFDVMLRQETANLAEGYLARGKAQIQIGNPGAAFIDFRQAVLHDASHLGANLALAESYLYYQQAFEQSLPFFDAALQISPDEPDANLGKGIALQKLKRYPLSKTYLERALQYPQTKAQGLYYLGFHALLAENEKGQACQYWQAALEGGVMESKRELANHCRMTD